MVRRKDDFENCKEELDKFYDRYIECPRNKIIAHNDREIYLRSESCISRERETEPCFNLPSNNQMTDEYLKKLGELSEILSQRFGESSKS